MKQIIPFKKNLLFKTKVSEVTSISLEHDFNVEDDVISGNFFISGDYKMTDASINRENFEFKLPFDIAIDSRYKKDSLVVDIDNFYYQIINNDTLEVNIDLFVDFEKEDIPIEVGDDNIRFEDLVNESDKAINLDESVSFDMPVKMDSIDIDNNNININSNNDFNIFDNVDDSETYKTYYVYIVKEDDTIDKILEKYNISKEELSMYNDIENIKPMDKVIIPSKNE